MPSMLARWACLPDFSVDNYIYHGVCFRVFFRVFSECFLNLLSSLLSGLLSSARSGRRVISEDGPFPSLWPSPGDEYLDGAFGIESGQVSRVFDRGFGFTPRVSR